MLDTTTTPAAPTTPDPASRIIDLLERIAERLDAGQVEALDAKSAAAFLTISVSKLHELNARGLLPAPVQIGDSDRLPRWSRGELLVWFRSGGPSRARWLMMKDAKMKQAAA
jgi:predicted DNA-binding transcriptional regulator AlpA